MFKEALALFELNGKGVSTDVAQIEMALARLTKPTNEMQAG